ncbi:MAG: hypothetical protein ACRDR6_04025 [Pseudonocardiaceae bacterium]
MAKRLQLQALPAIMLVIVVLWALVAVIFLTGTLAAADDISIRVGVINSSLTPINSKLNALPVLMQVSDNANKIRDAAAGLSPTIGRIADSAGSIDSSLKQVNDAVGPINKAVNAINGSVLAINKSVSTVGPNLVSVLGSAKSINSNVHSIDGELSGTLDNVFVARGEVVLINDEVDDVIRSVRDIKGDLDYVKQQVGTARFPGTVNGDAFGIETSPILLRSGNAGVFKEMALASTRQDPVTGQLGLPTLDLLPQISALGLPALSLPVPVQIPTLLGNVLQGLPIVGDTGDILGILGAGSK